MPHQHLRLERLDGVERNANHDDDGRAADGQRAVANDDADDDRQDRNDCQIQGAKERDLVDAVKDGCIAGKRDGRRVDLDGLELNGVLGIGVDIADIGAVNTHDSGDIAGADFLAFGAAQVVEGKELLDGSGGAGAVVLHNQNSDLHRFVLLCTS